MVKPAIQDRMVHLVEMAKQVLLDRMGNMGEMVEMEKMA